VIVLADSWLDIIELDKTTRKKATLKVLFEEPSGEPKSNILFNLFEFIKKAYGTDKCTILYTCEVFYVFFQLLINNFFRSPFSTDKLQTRLIKVAELLIS